MMRYLAILALVPMILPVFAQADCTRRPVKKVVITNQHYQKVVVVPKIVAVEVYRDHYYSLDPYYQQQYLAQENIRLLRAELLKLRQELRQGQGQGPQPKVEEGPQPKVEEGPKGESVAGKYQNAKLLAIVNNSCAKCHGFDAKRQTALVTKDGKALADVSAGKVWEAFGLVNSGEMPKAGNQIDDEGVKLFYEWAKNARK